MKTQNLPARRGATRRLLSLLMALALPAGAAMAAYPDAPIKLVVPFSPGGGTDTVARAAAQSLSKHLKQTVIVENRPGAAGAVGTMAVVRAQPDGYTLLLGSNGPIAISPSLDPKLPYDPARDLTAVAALAAMPFLLASNQQFEANDVKGLLDIARAKPGVLNFASPGTGTTNHLVGELLKTMGQVNMVHIPYKGASLAMNDVAGGSVHFMSGDINTLLPAIQNERLKPLAVTGAQRSPLLPHVPTVAESGLPGFEASGWFGLFAPAGTPEAIVDTLAKAVDKALEDPDVLTRIKALGGNALPLSGKAFGEFTASEGKKWKSVIDAHQLSASP